MQIIDLTRQTGCKIATFPDGEKHVTIDALDRKEPVSIVCRITCADDLFCLMQLGDILKRQEMEINTLFIGYLMTMRCDRLFDLNRPFSLKIVADAINAIGARNVQIIEPHSYRTMSLINKSVGVLATMEYFMNGILKSKELQLDVVAVMPDDGAKARYHIPNTIPSILCEKQRDPETGKLLSFEVCTKDTDICKDKDLVLMDDLCDGGGTFLGLAPKLRELAPKSISLLVTHAIQLDGIQKVAQAYDHVFITNSYKEWGAESELPDNVTVFKVFR